MYNVPDRTSGSGTSLFWSTLQCWLTPGLGPFAVCTSGDPSLDPAYEVRELVFSPLSAMLFADTQDVERRVQAVSGDRAPTHRCPVDSTFADKSEACNELVLSEVTVLTNCDPESEVPVECAQAPLRPVPKAGHAEETLDTSSQGSLSLTYHGEHGHEVIM